MTSPSPRSGVSHLGASTDAQWLSVSNADPAATFFQTPHWGILMAGAFPRRIRVRPERFRLADGVEAVFPLFQVSFAAGLRRELHTGFPSVYGGPLSPRPLTLDERAQVYAHFGRKTLAVLPAPGTEGAVPRGAQRRAFRLLRFPTRDGQGAPPPVEGGDLRYFPVREPFWWHRFYEMHRMSAAARGAPGAFDLPRELFVRLGVRVQKGIMLWVAARGRRIECGVVLLLHNRTANLWLNEASQESLSSGVFQVLLDRVFQYAAQEGHATVHSCPESTYVNLAPLAAHPRAEEMEITGWRTRREWVV